MCASFNVSSMLCPASDGYETKHKLASRALWHASELLWRTFQGYLCPSFNIDGAYKLLIIIVSYLNMSMIQVTVKTNQTNLMALEAHSRFTLIKCKMSRFWTEYVSVSRLTVAALKFACGFQRFQSEAIDLRLQRLLIIWIVCPGVISGWESHWLQIYSYRSEYSNRGKAYDLFQLVK